MNLEKLISTMMRMNTMGRLWHWTTNVAQHHVVYETFLNENEDLTDRFVESAIGNDLNLNFSQIGVEKANQEVYKLDNTQTVIKDYRNFIFEIKSELDKSQDNSAGAELISILDDVTELCSKTLYLLKLK